MGGAHALGLQDVIGSFDEGKELDALLLDTEVRIGFFSIVFFEYWTFFGIISSSGDLLLLLLLLILML